MSGYWFTTLCNKHGCHWQGSTTEYSEACGWVEDHDTLGDGHDGEIIDEPDEDDE